MAKICFKILTFGRNMNWGCHHRGGTDGCH